ncbi:MAG: hypothetical protein KA191_00125 [Verrucomicrobia bacterium]|nr:hypothetical protein [Verrucomicrobiota bacterium]OQC62604.1 MAG: hypothetical protein BWX48_03672 [Verrucomicrobia bacterium ADurb.Bin006]MDI9381165.1 hypothetical protein [Verrucomicrobiota bacterium]HOA59818.1 hypothetical protein [Verrucomicrobiota bacterium]HOF46652.1 hypothetical protein [Verrucomicrobiota bacterium]
MKSSRFASCLSALVLASLPAPAAALPDAPFRQPMAVRLAQAPELDGAEYRRLAVQRDGIAYVLTDKGVGRVFGERVALDQSFRPLAGIVPLDLVGESGHVFYLFEDKLLSNDLAGQYHVALPKGVYRSAAVNAEGVALLAAPTNLLLVAGASWTNLPFQVTRQTERVYAWGVQFFILANDTIYRMTGPQVDLFHRGTDLTALGFRGAELFVGTTRGYYVLDLRSGKHLVPLQERLPATHITALRPLPGALWAGTTQGAFCQTEPGSFKYYASKRWLPDDHVLDLQADPLGDMYVLTKGGLGKIEFPRITLADKARYYDDKIRQRHIRYGLCAELRLNKPGDMASAEMIDTDNDGTWSSAYLASQAFRYAATDDEKARANAWETFAALERLQSINGLDGFPARTFERTGFKVSDPERWHLAPERHWEWKAHTSSDEITGQTFAYAVLWEVAARTPDEKSRIAAGYERIINHILRHNYYLVDVDGQPTLWGRWHPEYVNHYPPTIVDRRLNSAEIIAFLQFAHHATGKPVYRDKAYELFERHGYLRNITNSMALIRPTPGFVFRGHDMGDAWNHSDDELAFYTYWVLYRFAFTEDLRRLYAAAIQDHWEIEKIERNPLWNFVLAATGADPFDIAGALWTLRNFPIDLVDWTVRNSGRQDLTRRPANFRGQDTEELLPPDERPIMRWNGNPFVLDGGNGGLRELAGDEFLLPYWMGRYLRLIE